MLNLLHLVFAALVISACQAEDGQRGHFDESYVVGMRAYTGEDWANCTRAMQQAVEDFERYNEGSVKCLRMCERQQVSRIS